MIFYIQYYFLDTFHVTPIYKIVHFFDQSHLHWGAAVFIFFSFKILLISLNIITFLITKLYNGEFTALINTIQDELGPIHME